jgi:hemolysin III
VSRAFVSRAVYGLISVLAVLPAMELQPPTAVEGAITLFGTTLAVALVDAYADSIAEMISRQRNLSRAELYQIGREVAPVLEGAQAPTLIFILAEVGLFSVERPIWLAQAVAILMLIGYGWRIGKLLHEHWPRQLLSGLLLVAIGGLAVGVKAGFH